MAIDNYCEMVPLIANVDLKPTLAYALGRATAHKLACLVYRMLRYGQEYVTQSMEEYEAKMKANMLKALQRNAAAMGFQLSPLPSP